MLKVAVLSTVKFSCRNHFVLNILEGMMHVLHEGSFPISFACSSGGWPGSGGVNKCCHGECGRLQHYFYDCEPNVPLSTCALPFCTQSVKSEMQLAHMQEVQTAISDKPTYHIQDVYGSSLKSVLQSESGGKHWGWGGPLGKRCKLLLPRVREDKET